MTKFNTIQFTAAAAIDLSGEFEELDAMIARGTAAAKEIEKQFRHLRSLIQGMSYTIEFIADEETSNELAEFLNDQDKELNSRWAKAMAIVWSDRLDCEIEIIPTIRPNASTTYTLKIDGNLIMTEYKEEDVHEYIHSMAK